jgi:hypothetical protein
MKHMHDHSNPDSAVGNVGVAQLLTISQAQLDELFTNGAAADLPNGEGEGTAIIAPGTNFTQPVAKFIRRFAWQGKIFDAENGLLKNKILYFGLYAVTAKVYRAPSRLDGKECIVLDYSRTSMVAHWIRDEIRLIAPGLYLGKAYWGKVWLFDFALQFADAG